MEGFCGNALVAGREQHAYYDIVGSLPLELVVSVVEYLDETDIVRSRRVSKRWRTIFSCDTITKSVLPRTLAALGMETADVRITNATTYIQWLHNLRTARPVKKVFLPWPEDVISLGKPRNIGCNSRRLCYIIPERGRDKVAMLDLETGRRSTWINDTRRPIEDIRLSDRYLFMITQDSIISAVDIHTPQRWVGKQFPWPTYRVRITIEKDKLVILPFSIDEAFPLWMWDLRSDRVQTIGSFISKDLDFWHVDADENVLITFEVNWDEHPLLVHQTRWTLTRGEVLDRKIFRLSLGGRRVSRRDIFLKSHHNFGRTTEARVRLKGCHTTIFLIYDHAIQRLSLRWFDSTEPITDRAGQPGGGPCLAPLLKYGWMSEHKGIAVWNAATGTTTLHGYQLDFREVSAHKRLAAPLPPPSSDVWARRFAAFFMDSCLSPFGDHEVFGMASDDGIQLWFFNPNFVPDLPFAEPFLAMQESG